MSLQQLQTGTKGEVRSTYYSGSLEISIIASSIVVMHAWLQPVQIFTPCIVQNTSHRIPQRTSTILMQLLWDIKSPNRLWTRQRCNNCGFGCTPKPSWDSHLAALQELDCQGFSLNLWQGFPDDRTDTYEYQYHSRCVWLTRDDNFLSTCISYQHIYLSLRTSLSLWSLSKPCHKGCSFFLVITTTDLRRQYFWGALSAEESSSLTESNSNHR